MKNRAFCETIQRFQEAVTKAVRRKIAFSTILALFMLSGIVSAQSGPTEFVPFSTFIEQTVNANAGDYLARPASKVKDTVAFEEMRQHILTRYQGVEVQHSFVLDSTYFDCVPIEQQPAVRKYDLKKIASPPPQSILDNSAHNQAADDLQRDPKEPFDAFGNSVYCEEHTIPLLRITLETITRFQTLRQFFQKSPDGAEQVPGQNHNAGPESDAHKYSITYQNVNNHGGNSNLNVWSPHVDTSKGEVFSLSQEWYVGGSGSGLQTEEVGWIVYPDMFSGDEKSHFFIFSTPDNYKNGCYNNTCGDFVQVADNGLLGASFNHYSSFGGTQYEFGAIYYLYEKNWWLGYGGGSWVGYYPGTYYHGGQNSRYAQIVEYGTESVGSKVWPPEGSGDWPYRGFGYAAYQRDLYYINTKNQGIWESLNPYMPSPTCYSIRGPYSGTGDWTVYFYEGGPGGSGC